MLTPAPLSDLAPILGCAEENSESKQSVIHNLASWAPLGTDIQFLHKIQKLTLTLAGE
jgi:hypothetical protein